MFGACGTGRLTQRTSAPVPRPLIASGRLISWLAAGLRLLRPARRMPREHSAHPDWNSYPVTETFDQPDKLLATLV